MKGYSRNMSHMYSETCLIRHTKGPGKYVGLYTMSEYSGYILVNRNTLGPYIFVGCHRMSENSGVGLHKFYCILNYILILVICKVGTYIQANKKHELY